MGFLFGGGPKIAMPPPPPPPPAPPPAEDPEVAAQQARRQALASATKTRYAGEDSEKPKLGKKTLLGKS